MKRILILVAVTALIVSLSISCKSTESSQLNAADEFIKPVRPEKVREVNSAFVENPKASSYTEYSFNTEQKFQTIEGFGAAYTWYSDWLFHNNKSGSEALDSLFSFAKLNVLRFKNEFEYNRPGVAENAASCAKYYKGAVERFAEFGEKPVVLMSCWSPAAYLKSNGKIEGSKDATLKRNEDGNYCYEEYADWWTRAVKYYEDAGVHIDYVSLQNEVDFTASYDGCRFSSNETKRFASYAKAFAAVYKSFQKEFGENAPKLIAPETMSCKKMDILPFIKEIEKELPGENSVNGIAHHLYIGGNGDEKKDTVDADSFMMNFMDLYTAYPDVSRWQTEYYIGHSIQQAELINNCLTMENANVYLFWSGVWTKSNKKFECADLSSVDWNGNWTRRAKYYVMRHFSEYIRPGYIRIAGSSGIPGVESSAYISPDGKSVTVVLINTNDETVGVKFGNSAYKINAFMAYQSVFGDVSEDESSCWIDRGVFKANGKLGLYPKSVTTVVLNGTN